MNGHHRQPFPGLRTLAALGLVALAAGLCAPAAGAATPRKQSRPAAETADAFHWSSPMRAGRTLEVRGINGGIRAVAAAGGEAAVEAVRRGRRSDPAEVEIRVHDTDEGVRICAHYPRPDGSMNEDCTSQQTRDNDVQVQFTVRVPAGVRLEAHTVNGNLSADGLVADADLETVNGNVSVASTGAASAVTVNGNVEASIGRMPEDGGLEFRTVNGSVAVAIPADTDAELRAVTTNGTVSCALAMGDAMRRSKRSLRGTLGRGGPRLEMETVNGSIRIVPR